MLKIAICEDNIPYSKLLSQKVSSFFRNKEIDTNISMFSFTEKENKFDYNHYNLFLLDIELGHENGIELGIKIKKHNPNATIIYISAFYTYAIAGYKARPIAYILKSDPQFDKT